MCMCHSDFDNFLIHKGFSGNTGNDINIYYFLILHDETSQQLKDLTIKRSKDNLMDQYFPVGQCMIFKILYR